MILHQLPWHEDIGQHWISDVLSKTGLLDYVRETLMLDTSKSHIQIRLACEVLWILKCADVESVSDDDIALGLGKLREIVELPLYSERNPETCSLVDRQIEALEVFE